MFTCEPESIRDL